MESISRRILLQAMFDRINKKIEANLLVRESNLLDREKIGL
jgi:hypothetical protein